MKVKQVSLDKSNQHVCSPSMTDVACFLHLSYILSITYKLSQWLSLVCVFLGGAVGQQAPTDTAHLNLITHSLYCFQTRRAWYEINLQEPSCWRAFLDVCLDTERSQYFSLCSRIWCGDDCVCVCACLHFPNHVYICESPVQTLFVALFFKWREFKESTSQNNKSATWHEYRPCCALELFDRKFTCPAKNRQYTIKGQYIIGKSR